MKHTVWLLLVLLFPLMGCRVDPMEGESVTPTPSIPIHHTVLVRVENQSEFDFEQVQITYPGKNDARIQVPSLLAGYASPYFPLAEFYQSAAIELWAEGRRYNLEPLDLAMESPATTGNYRYQLNLENDRLTLNVLIEEDARQAAIAPLVQRLANGGLSVGYEPTFPILSPFNKLMPEATITTEMVWLDADQAWVYVFEDEATAVTAAAMIEPGGTSIRLTSSDGVVVREFVGGLGSTPMWWQWERYLLLLGEFPPTRPETTTLITQALEREPIESESLKEEGVYVRLANVSDMDFERVMVTVHLRESEYGTLPTSQVSAYQLQNGIYRYTGMKVSAGDDTYQFVPIDFMGETPLSPGRYTFALEVAGEQVTMLPIPDDAILNDPALAGRWFWSNAQLPDGTFISPTGYEGEIPYLQLSEQPNSSTGELAFLGYGGCNQLFGTYRVNPDERVRGFVTSGVGSTAQDCGAPFMENERLLQSALTGIVHYQVEGDTLSLYTPTGDTLTLVRE